MRRSASACDAVFPAEARSEMSTASGLTSFVSLMTTAPHVTCPGAADLAVTSVSAARLDSRG
jgi:hypothetical protein